MRSIPPPVPPPAAAAPPPAAAAPPVPPPAPVAAEAGREPKFTDVVEQALLDELARRVDLGAHAQLGVAVDAGDADIEEAYARLKERYAPSIFARYGATTGAVVKSINDVIDTAHAKLLDPSERRALVIAAHQPTPTNEPTPDQLEQKRRGEEARTALRAGIDRRVEEACAHRDMGRLDEAIRSFEAVITLDRKNDYAKEELRKLRDLKAKRKR
jgi:tetratricopeptide (TPR) repeat protein